MNRVTYTAAECAEQAVSLIASNGLNAPKDETPSGQGKGLEGTQQKQQADSTQQVCSIGAFPTRHNTVTAETLSQLLRGGQLTSMDGVSTCNTTRLAARVHNIKKSYGWDIERVNRDVGTDDGRISTVCVYSLPRSTIRSAFDAGALAFCRSVDSARAKLRSGATKAKVEARRRNAARAAAKLDLNQGSLFEATHE